MTTAQGLEPVGAQARPASSGLPIVPKIPVILGEGERRELSRLAARILADEPALARTDVFGARVTSNLLPGPKVVFEDHSEVPLFAGSSQAVLEYRALLLGGDDDLVIVTGPRNSQFEAYCRDLLGLGHPSIARVGPSGRGRRQTIAQRIARDDAIMGQILELAGRHGTVSLVPYLGTGSTWVLAAQVASASRAKVGVTAPPPRLTRRVNDKLWFSERVTELLGRRARPPTYMAYGLAALAGQVARLARRYERVVIKVPDSAGSLGNLVFSASDLGRLDLAELRDMLDRVLTELGLAEAYPLIVGVWDCPVMGSPSVQLWVPRASEGLPVVEGLFDQIVVGRASEFVGAIPSALSPAWHDRLATEAAQLATLLQALGYFGRCSFDAVLVGERLETAEVHWLECNGRWGGVSLPMTLANRLTGDWARRPFAVVQRTRLSLEPMAFDQALTRLQGRLFRPGTDNRGIVLLTPGNVVAGSGLHFMVLADNAAAARAEAEVVTRFLTAGASLPDG